MIRGHLTGCALLLFSSLLAGNAQAGTTVAIPFITGAPTVIGSPLATKDFGNSLVGTPVAGAQETVTVNLAGTTLPVQITGIAATGDFSVTGGTCTNAAAQYLDGNTCTLDLQFLPAAPGTRTGQLSITCRVVATLIGVVGLTCDGGSHTAYNLTGNGILAALMQAVPTLGREGITLLALLMVIVSSLALRRRK